MKTKKSKSYAGKVGRYESGAARFRSEYASGGPVKPARGKTAREVEITDWSQFKRAPKRPKA
jgi:hypothetical protein